MISSSADNCPLNTSDDPNIDAFFGRTRGMSSFFVAIAARDSSASITLDLMIVGLLSLLGCGPDGRGSS
jgi:hypothetical protein